MWRQRISHLARSSARPVFRSTALQSHSRRWATSVTPHSTAADPAETEALKCLEMGTLKLEEGDVPAAKELYKRSVEIRRNASSLFNLGVTHYHLKEFDDAIGKSTLFTLAFFLTIQCSILAGVHCSAAVFPGRSHQSGVRHLRIAATLSPEDPEIAFNLAAVLEATGDLEEALEQYQRSRDRGVERAAMHVRNVSAKIVGRRMKEAEELQEAKKII
ncbi:TPR-like protein [Mycena sanguinolenta]|uniref:TPR-like protein n=1 Tax=Mycena sanguinolenta TaxID=230812 RepID=A0A8H6Z4M3_9AGAR|nr:TPR-like protein [Mycena sanguinolenta]